MRFFAWLKKPWFHFVLLGSLLFYLQGVFFPQPKPVIGPLNAARIEALQEQWFSSTGRVATSQQMERMIAAELDRDMLFQRAVSLDLHLRDTVIYQRLLRNMRFLKLGEDKSDLELYEMALDMRLHLGDEVVKRRLIQVMEQLLLAANPPSPVTEEALAAEFAERGQELHRPPRYSIEHIYFNRDREPEVESVIAKIQAENLGPTEARQLSSPFLPGYQFRRQTPDQLARHFGASFVMNLQQQEPVAQQWVGPVNSTYGVHYVWMDEVEPARPATLEEVRLQLTRDLESRAKAAALRDGIDGMREQYEIRS